MSVKVVRCGPAHFICHQSLNALRPDMNYSLDHLQNSFNHKKRLFRDYEAMFFKHLRCGDGVAHAGFIFKTQEHKALRCARSLATVECQSSAEFSFSSP